MAITHVQVENGLLEGLSTEDGLISSFKGIPYAAPPVGELRWREPQPAQNWEGIRKAYDYAPMSLQRIAPEGSFARNENPEVFPMSEDCLYMNIWTPAKQPDEKLPVAFWIFGGGFQAGTPNNRTFNGENLCKKGVVVVNFAHRVNIFGFFAHPELTAESPHHVSGNYGILDQICALNWVKRNIQNFGGDPDNITVFGQSSGAGSTVILSTSPLSKGLFKRAIVESVGDVVVSRKPSLDFEEKRGIAYLESLGVKSIAEARKLSSEEVFKPYSDVKAARDRSKVFDPNVDGYVMKEDPVDAVAAGRHWDIDYLWGGNAEEGNYLGPVPDITLDDFEKETQMIYGDKAEALLKAGNITNAEQAKELKKNNMAIGCLARCIAFCERQLKYGRKPCYEYLFSRKVPGDDAGAFHGAETPYVFNNLKGRWRPYTKWDYKLADIISSYWTNFMKTGNPNGEGLPEWKPFTEDNRQLMDFGNEQVKMTPIPESEVIDFQKAFIYREL